MGYFPTESSEHGSEYLSWFLRDEAQIEKLPPLGRRVRLPLARKTWANTRRRRRRSRRGSPLGHEEPSDEYAPQIIHSIETSTPRVVYGNVHNDGLIDNLPADACVEVPCLVDGTGVNPVRIGSLPPQLAALNRTFLNVADLTVRAALEGRPDRVRQAVLLDPNASSTLTPDAIWEMCDELTAAHGDLLPEALREPVGDARRDR